MLQITENTIFSISPNVTIKNILGKTFFMLDKNSGKQYDLTELEYDILNMMQKQYSFVKIKEIICKEYDIAFKQAETDIKEYVESLYENRLITLKEGDVA